MTIKEFETFSPTDYACKTYLQSRRWPMDVACQRCFNEKVYSVTNKHFHWQCQGCTPGGGYCFSVLGTIIAKTGRSSVWP